MCVCIKSTSRQLNAVDCIPLQYRVLPESGRLCRQRIWSIFKTYVFPDKQRRKTMCLLARAVNQLVVFRNFIHRHSSAKRQLRRLAHTQWSFLSGDMFRKMYASEFTTRSDRMDKVLRRKSLDVFPTSGLIAVELASSSVI